MIICGEDFLQVDAEQHLAILLRRLSNLGILEVVEDKERLLFPVVNHGRWIVECPFCNGSEILWRECLLFMCQSCWNKAIDHKFISIVLPEKAQKIEILLLLRPNIENRNWSGETLRSLALENIEHGLEVR